MPITELDWMRKAERAALKLRAATVGKPRAGHSVYVILLHDVRLSGRWGLYVGQTSRDADWRFDQHKAGYRASNAVKRFGVRLLPELVAHLNPITRHESLVSRSSPCGGFSSFRRPLGRGWPLTSNAGAMVMRGNC